MNGNRIYLVFILCVASFVGGVATERHENAALIEEARHNFMPRCPYNAIEGSCTDGVISKGYEQNSACMTTTAGIYCPRGAGGSGSKTP